MNKDEYRTVLKDMAIKWPDLANWLKAQENTKEILWTQWFSELEDQEFHDVRNAMVLMRTAPDEYDFPAKYDYQCWPGFVLRAIKKSKGKAVEASRKADELDTIQRDADIREARKKRREGSLGDFLGGSDGLPLLDEDGMSNYKDHLKLIDWHKQRVVEEWSEITGRAPGLEQTRKGGTFSQEAIRRAALSSAWSKKASSSEASLTPSQDQEQPEKEGSTTTASTQ